MQWITINDYSTMKNISISTIRRYIKKDKVEWKKLDGKYLIAIDNYENLADLNNEKSAVTIQFLKNEIIRLRAEVRSAKEECSEYKMLVALYENQDQVSNNEIQENYIH